VGDLLPELKGKGFLKAWARFICYLPWLMWQIWLANLHILRISLHPRAIHLIDPQIITFRPQFESDLAKVTMANSITLTPGTITIYVSIYGDFSVHAIDRASAEGILNGEMERKVKKAFGELK
jgi:multicomponent Na+:H+ antiporter subunit E